MGKTVSPLRYPGGKYKIYNKVKALIESGEWGDKTYVEPFSGGFAIGIGLLQDGVVQSAIINDFDSHIYNFWDSVINQTDALVRMIEDTPITMHERGHQKAIYDDPNSGSLEDGFATLFLNRVNYSGVIKGGPIGGAAQNGKYKLDCRFPKKEIIKRISAIAKFQDSIQLYNCDAEQLITETLAGRMDELFFNIDPPYVEKGSLLYTNFFETEDHRALARTIREQLQGVPWIVTYDDSELVRQLYMDFHIEEYTIIHNAGKKARNRELVITNIAENRFRW